MRTDMNDPISASAGFAAGSKAIGGVGGSAIVAGLAAVAAMIIVMLMTLPRTIREWTVGLISTAIASLAGGAYVTIKLGLLTEIIAATAANDTTTLYFALIQLFGVVFICGLPGWAIVRAVFLYIERNKDKDIGQIVDDVKEKI